MMGKLTREATEAVVVIVLLFIAGGRRRPFPGEGLVLVGGSGDGV